MLMERIRKWLKLLALWAWVHFITLLASDPDAVPKIKYVEEGKETNIQADQTSDVHQIGSKKKRSRKSNQQEVKEETPSKDQEEIQEETPPKDQEERHLKDQQDFADDEISLEINFEEEEITRDIDKEIGEENECLENGHLEVEEEKEEEEDDIPWLGVGRGTGLTRYSGIQNLMDTSNSADEPLHTDKRSPVLILRRDGPLVLQRPSFGRSFSQEKERLSEIPEEDKQSPPAMNEEVGDESDILWASLVARYGKEEDTMDVKRNGHCRDQNALQQPIFTSPEESISSKEFSNQVEERLQLYLSKIDGKEETAFVSNNVTAAPATTLDDDTREIDEDEAASMTLDENVRLGNENKIFILIEDDDSNEERDDDIVCRKYEVCPVDSYTEEKSFFELQENIEDSKILNAIDEEDEITSDKDEVSVASGSSSIGKEGSELATEPKLMDSNFPMPSSVKIDESFDYNSQKEDIFHEEDSDEEEIEEVSKTAVFTISLHKKQETPQSMDYMTEEFLYDSENKAKSYVENIDSVTETSEDDALITETTEDDALITETTKDDALISESIDDGALISETTEDDALISEPIEEGTLIIESIEEDSSVKETAEDDTSRKKTELSFTDEQVTVDFTVEKAVSYPAAFTKERRRQSRDIWKMDCEKVLGAQESPQNISMEKKDDFFSTTYEEFPEDCVAEDLLAITQRFGIPVDIETPREGSEEEDESIFDSVFEEPKLLIDREVLDLDASDLIPDETEVKDDGNIFIYEDSSLRSQGDFLTTSFKGNDLGALDMDDGTSATKEINVDGYPLSVDADIAVYNQDVEMVNEQVLETTAIVRDTVIDKVDVATTKTIAEMKSEILDLETEIELKKGEEISVIREDKGVSSSEETMLGNIGTAEAILEKQFIGSADISVSDTFVEKGGEEIQSMDEEIGSEVIAHEILEENMVKLPPLEECPGNMLESIRELGKEKVSKQIIVESKEDLAFPEQMEMPLPKLEVDVQEPAAVEMERLSEKGVLTSTETGDIIEQGIICPNVNDAEVKGETSDLILRPGLEEEMVHELKTEIEQHEKETSWFNATLEEVNAVASVSKIEIFKENETVQEQPQTEPKKKVVAKSKKGKLDSILKRFEEKEEPVIKKTLIKKKIGTKVNETKPSSGGLENIQSDKVILPDESEAVTDSSIAAEKSKSKAAMTLEITESKNSTAYLEEGKDKLGNEEIAAVFQQGDMAEIRAGNASFKGDEVFITAQNVSEDMSFGELHETNNVEKPSFLPVKDALMECQPITEDYHEGIMKEAEDLAKTPLLKGEISEISSSDVESATHSNEIDLAFKMEVVDTESITGTADGKKAVKFESTGEFGKKEPDHSESINNKSEAQELLVTCTKVPLENTVTVNLPKKKRFKITSSEIVEPHEPVKMVKAAVRKGKLDNILKRFEEKESEPTVKKPLSKLDSSVRKKFGAQSTQAQPGEVLKSFQAPGNGKFSIENYIKESASSIEMETVEKIADSNDKMETKTGGDSVGAKLEASEITDSEKEFVLPIEKEVQSLLSESEFSEIKTPVTESIIGKAIAAQNTNEQSGPMEELRIENSESLVRKTGGVKVVSELGKSFSSNILGATTEGDLFVPESSDLTEYDQSSFTGREKESSLLSEENKKNLEKSFEVQENYYLIADNKEQQTAEELIDEEREKSYWFDNSSVNQKETEYSSIIIDTDKEESSFWFEDGFKEEQKSAPAHWFEETEEIKTEEDIISSKINEFDICPLPEEPSFSAEKGDEGEKALYYREEDDDLYYLKDTKEKPFTQEKDEELALLRMETMELSNKKQRKDFGESSLKEENSKLDFLLISEEDRLEKKRILRAIRSEREAVKSGLVPAEVIPDYLDDVKDLLVPKIRRKKGRKSRLLDDIMKANERDVAETNRVASENALKLEDRARTDIKSDYVAKRATSETSENISNKFLTDEEENELMVIRQEQEAVRATQRKELEKYMAMPAALTEQEQQELEELLTEEETDKAVNAATELRLEALLTEVRKRIGGSDLDLENAAALEEYIGLPVGLTEEEERLLANVGVEKDRSQFASDDEYRDYIKQRYLDELEDERIRVEEDEYEFGGYYDDDDYDYEGDYDEEEYLEEDYDIMESDVVPDRIITKDEAVGSDEPMELDNEEGDNVKLKKSKNLLSSLSSLRSKGSKSSSGSLDKQGSNYSSKEGSSSDLQNDATNSQTKKFFRFGGLSIKRKKKSKEFPQKDPDSILTSSGGVDEADMSSLSSAFQFNNLNNDKLSIVDNENTYVKVDADFCDSEDGFVVISANVNESNYCDYKEDHLMTYTNLQPCNLNFVDFKSVALTDSVIDELHDYKSSDSEKGISDSCDPPLLPPSMCENKENAERIGVTADLYANVDGVSDRVEDSGCLSEDWEIVDSKELGRLSYTNREIPKIFNTDVSDITTKIFSILKQKNAKQRNISPLNQIQNTMASSPVTELKTVKRERELLSDTGNKGCCTFSTLGDCDCKHLTFMEDPLSSDDDPCNIKHHSGKSRSPRSIEEAKLKVSKMSAGKTSEAMEDESELWPEEEKRDDMDEFQKMEQEVEREMEEEKKKKKSDTDKRGKKKKKRKGESEKENKKTTYQSKDELHEKHVGPRVRSFDAAKMKSKFNKPKEPTQVSTDCRICGKQVFQMEKIVAEKASWHKNCFRCTECNKNLTLETYQSHEGSLYCKPHFKELFRPKAVVQDEAEERKDRLLRRPRMIILESQPEVLPDDVVRASAKPDYGLEELQTSLNVKERFSLFESYSKTTDEPKLEPVSVRRSQSLMSKAARFSNGHQNGDQEYEEEEEYESGEEGEEDEEGEEGESEDPNYVKSRKKKERPMSFSGMGDLKAVWEQKQRREEMTQARKEDISKFRQMLCAGKNITLKEMFESGNFEGADENDSTSREEIKIEERRAAHNLKARFEKGQPFILEDEEGSEEGSRKDILVGEREEVEEVFRDAQTAKQARNVFKQIDSQVAQEGSVILRSPSFANQNRDNRRSLDGLSQGADDLEVLGRNPNLIKCTDNYQDEVDCRNTKNILQMFKKMEMGDNEEEDEEGPRPLKCFTPPPEDGDDEESEYSDEEYSDEGEEESEEEDEGKPKFKDELLEMGTCPQSARKAANLRAKFEKWESEVDRQNELNRDKDGELEEECRPSLDTTRNLKAMFEHKAIEVTKPVTSKPVSQKINRFVGSGEKCMSCDKTVYAMEKLEIHGKILHKNCFKCFKCNSRLSMGSFSIGGDKMFCTTHYKQLFAEKGSYDAFQSGKDKWTSKIEATNVEAIKSHD